MAEGNYHSREKALELVREAYEKGREAARILRAVGTDEDRYLVLNLDEALAYLNDALPEGA